MIKRNLASVVLLIGIALSNLSFELLHDYYVSVTRIEYVKEQKSLQIITQIFIDDFEKLIQERYDETIILAIENENSMVDSYIKRYLNQKLQFEINTKAVAFNFLGKEYKDDIVYCYLEIENVEDIKTMVITNDILYDIYNEQQNIVRTKIKGKNKSFILLSGNNKGVLNFD